MEAKEKAKELFEKFTDELGLYIVGQKAAIMAVDEILNTKSVYHSYEENEYWENVKEELQKL